MWCDEGHVEVFFIGEHEHEQTKKCSKEEFQNNKEEVSARAIKAKAICDKMKCRNKVLQALACSTWGADKETSLASFNAIGGQLYDPIVVAYISATKWKNIQTIQNAALRTATGCLLTTSVDRLHKEVKVLPVSQHNLMFSLQ